MLANESIECFFHFHILILLDDNVGRGEVDMRARCT